jgi:hypothetical protein
MGRLGLGVLLALGVACGGSAERNGATAGGSAGAITGGAGMATGGAGKGGGAGQGGVMAIGGGGSGGMWACGASSVVEYPQGSIAEPSGFVGTMDGTPIRLRASDPDLYSSEPGTMHAVVASCGGRAFELYLYFDAPFAGESLEIFAYQGDACQIQAQYSLGPDTLVPLGATLELKLEVWTQYQGDVPPPFFHGSFTADVRSMDGIPVRTIQGEFAVQAGRQICI